MQELSLLHTIFTRTKDGIGTFRNMIQPLIDHATDEHTKLYYHHISEEEEQRLERLDELIPYLEKLIKEGKLDQLSDRDLSRLLSDLHLERFGLHNFREHLELALYEFKEGDVREQLNTMREATQQDYLKIKDIMAEMAERFSDAVPNRIAQSYTQDHDHGHDVHQVDHFHASQQSTPAPSSSASSASIPAKKGLTVGSLKQK
ncbi:IMEF encapsulin system ferritin-like cargo protein [Brevibacillus dissolubilis]|uniref:IMEF encapsulin system ferritin-like cargo protein n=1 Tax=Brevibacillus dissolubilis TaxID=1844116 RepID=UPI001115F273|nr:IMEF encapsulin system ferritin-like cargo protein [Brevibacillus dissolubilis]